MDCEGRPHSLHELCGQVVWLWEYADWCTTCRAFARDRMAPLYERFGDDPRFAPRMIISANSSFGAPTQADCAAIRARYPVPFEVWFDPENQMQEAFSLPYTNDIHLVLDPGSRVRWVGPPRGVEEQIEAALASASDR